MQESDGATPHPQGFKGWWRTRRDRLAIDVASPARLLAIGVVGGWCADIAGLPIPYLIGSLFTVAAYVIVTAARSGAQHPFPQGVRTRFVATIGVMIGATFSPDLVAVLPSLWLSLLAMVGFVWVAGAAAFVIFRYVGNYDPVTALYAGMPGGLIESTALGEQAGGDVRILSAQHFLRIVLVVTTVPLLFYIWSGESVGSTAGQTLASATSGPIDVALIIVMALVGFWLGPRLKIPAPHMMAPLLLSAVAHGVGLVDLVPPNWLLNLAQLVVGTGLGALFGGATFRLLLKALWLGALAVGTMLGIGMAFALTISPLTPISTQALFISFAPGGVTEMGLIALSLNVSPVVVAAHHLFRIIVTVFFAGRILRLGSFGLAPKTNGRDP